jgi:hypothetical protein
VVWCGVVWCGVVWCGGVVVWCRCLVCDIHIPSEQGGVTSGILALSPIRKSSKGLESITATVLGDNEVPYGVCLVLLLSFFWWLCEQERAALEGIMTLLASFKEAFLEDEAETRSREPVDDDSSLG